ncbi:MAG: hypothetical protein HXY50_07180 [Ignavibacteriaceae bacterium]|nr:hypothetical protein [Ignavibacteriaceae bacterium]
MPFQIDYKRSADKIIRIENSTDASLINKTILKINSYTLSSPEETETFLDAYSKGNTVKVFFTDHTTVEAALINYYSVLYIFLSWLIGSSFFAIGIVVLIKAKAYKPARLFHWVTVFTALMIMMTWGYYNIEPKPFGYLIREILHLSVSIIPALFLHFTLSFPREKIIGNKKRLSLLYTFSFLVFGLLTYSFVLILLEPTSSRINAYVISYNLSRVFLIICVIIGIAVFIHSYKNSPIESDKKKLKWILFGLFLGPLGFVLFWTLPIIIFRKPMVSEEIVLILISIIPITFGISIVKYHLMDIDQVINRSVVYFFVIGVLLLLYLLIISLLANFAIQVESKVFSIITALTVVLLFQPLKNKTQKFVDKKFFRVQYDFREELKKFFDEIANSFDIKLLAHTVVARIESLLPVKKIGFFILSEKDKLQLVTHHNFDLLINRTIKFQRENLKTDLSLPVAVPSSIEPGVLIETADLEVFRRWGINLVFPIKSTKDELHGFLVLGEKKSESRFTVEDIDLISAVVGRMAVSIDRIKLQEKLLAKRLESERLKELNQMKSYFISSVSHDMKTPLTSIKMFAELLKSSKEINSDKAGEYLEMIEGETNRLTRLIDNVLDFSKIERGIKEYHLENISLNEVVSRTMKMMQYQFKLHKFEVEQNLSEKEKLIYADKDAVEEALLNLLSNSIKYSGDNKIIKVTTQLENNFMILSVEDKGIGIDKDNLKNIFNPFFRINSKMMQKSGGAGLGLSIVKHIMDAHKGKIEVQSEFGKGSKFSSIFPVVPE